MQHNQALQRLRAMFRRDDAGLDANALSGPTLIEQEPDLARETARYNVSTSAWAASGHPTD